MKGSVFFVAIGLFVASCTNNQGFSARDTIVGKRENGIVANGIKYSFRLKEGSPKDADSVYYVVISQSSENGRNVLEYQAKDYELYSKRIQYYLSEASNDIKLIACGDTLTPVDYIYENNLGIVSENKIVATFYKKKPDCQAIILFDDRAFDNFFLKFKL